MSQPYDWRKPPRVGQDPGRRSQWSPWRPTPAEISANRQVPIISVFAFYFGFMLAYALVDSVFLASQERFQYLATILAIGLGCAFAWSLTGSRPERDCFLPCLYRENAALTAIATAMSNLMGGGSMRVHVGPYASAPVIIRRGEDMLIDGELARGRAGTLRFIFARCAGPVKDWPTSRYVLFSLAGGFVWGIPLSFYPVGAILVGSLFVASLLVWKFWGSARIAEGRHRSRLELDYRAFAAADCTIFEAAEGIELLTGKGPDAQRLDALKLRVEAMRLEVDG